MTRRQNLDSTARLTLEETEQKIHAFVCELLREEFGLIVSSPTLDYEDENRRDFFVELDESSSKLMKLYKTFKVNYKIRLAANANSFILYGLEGSWVNWNGGSNGNNFPFGQYEFDLEGNLLTQGKYEVFPKVEVGQLFTDGFETFRKIEPVLYSTRNGVRYNAVIVSGDYKGEKYLVKDSIVLVLPEGKEDGAA